MRTPLWLFAFLVAILGCGCQRVAGGGSARAVAAENQIADLGASLRHFESNCGRYPSTTEGLLALLNAPASVPKQAWRGPYLKTPFALSDPWQTKYVYRCPGIHNTSTFDLYSVGDDCRSRTGGEDPDDINNWDKSRRWRDYYGISERDPSPLALLALVLLGFVWLGLRKLRPGAGTSVKS
jgi:general secretion pathway protein G